MTVEELIEALRDFDPEGQVKIIDNGVPTDALGVFFDNNIVVIAH